MAERADNIVTSEYKEEQRPASPLHETNHTMVDKITKALVRYLDDQRIVALEPLVAQIQSHDAAFKLAFIKSQMCPRVNGLRAHIEEFLHKEKVSVESQVLDKIERFLRALCDLADQ